MKSFELIKYGIRLLLGYWACRGLFYILIPFSSGEDNVNVQVFNYYIPIFLAAELGVRLPPTYTSLRILYRRTTVSFNHLLPLLKDGFPILTIFLCDLRIITLIRFLEVMSSIILSISAFIEVERVIRLEWIHALVDVYKLFIFAKVVYYLFAPVISAIILTMQLGVITWQIVIDFQAVIKYILRGN